MNKIKNYFRMLYFKFFIKFFRNIFKKCRTKKYSFNLNMIIINYTVICRNTKILKIM